MWSLENIVIPETRIVGGLDARPGELLFVASLQTIQHSHFCGAVIISSRWVLTAASCLEIHWAGAFTVRTGTHIFNQGGVDHQTTLVLKHELYHFQSRLNDIALVQTATAIIPNAQTAFATVSTTFSGPETFATMSGWGHTQHFGQRSFHLQYFQTPIVTNEVCRSLLEFSGFAALVTNTNICALTQFGQGMCRGDSGSPLVVGNEIIGIASFGVSCATGVPDVYTRVSEYADWIHTMLSFFP